jgi:tripartite-type tricarboxylate transporter receptor subunit TctC
MRCDAKWAELGRPLLLLAGLLLAAPAPAQDYPVKPIRLIVPYGAGGGSDFVGRVIGQKLSELLGQQVVVDNRPGAASLLGTEIAARSAPDGYTLLLADSGFTINPAFYRNIKYDPIKDFDPVSVVAETPYLLVVNPGLPYAGSLAEFLAAAKARPGAINMGSAGSGSGTHLTGELLKLRAGINLTHVPYKSAGAAVADVVGGQIQSTMSSPPAVLPLAKAGKRRVRQAQRADAGCADLCRRRRGRRAGDQLVLDHVGRRHPEARNQAPARGAHEGDRRARAARAACRRRPRAGAQYARGIQPHDRRGAAALDAGDPRRGNQAGIGGPP